MKDESYFVKPEIKYYRLLAILFAMFIINICCVYTRDFRLYDEPVLPHNKIAILVSLKRDDLRIHKIDGEDISISTNVGESFYMEFLPGTHNLEVSCFALHYYQSTSLVSSSNENIRFEAKAGRKYLISVSITGTYWYPVISEITDRKFYDLF